MGSHFPNRRFNAVTPFHKADVNNLKINKRVKWLLDFCSDVLRSAATEVVTHQLAVLETCGRGIALITVPQPVVLARRTPAL